jgi:hypothetical protein
MDADDFGDTPELDAQGLLVVRAGTGEILARVRIQEDSDG